MTGLCRSLSTRPWRALALALGLGIMAGAAFASPHFPQRPLTLIVPYAPGGSADQLGRAVAQLMSESLGQSVVVENKPGANTQIAASTVARAAPDGYTLLMASSASMVLNPLLYKSISYNVDDLATLAVVAEIPLVAVVNPSVPVSTLAELVAYDKANPGKLNYASVGKGNPIHLAAEMLKLRTGMTTVHVPYNGSAPALASLMANDVQLMMDVVSTSLPLIRSGKLRALAVSSAERLPPLPDVPTVAESGYPGYQAATWFGLALPAGVPADVRDTLRAAADKAMSSESLRRTFNDLGLIVQSPRPPTALATYVSEDRERWKTIIEKNGITLE
jgi:tripartite-type tricarboxylate transporter receptor subunit TctC